MPVESALIPAAVIPEDKRMSERPCVSLPTRRKIPSSKKPANRILQQLREQDIITVLAEDGGRRATTYVFSRLLAITAGNRL